VKVRDLVASKASGVEIFVTLKKSCGSRVQAVLRDVRDDGFETNCWGSDSFFRHPLDVSEHRGGEDIKERGDRGRLRWLKAEPKCHHSWIGVAVNWSEPALWRGT
jgi:hypothetical protein